MKGGDFGRTVASYIRREALASTLVLTAFAFGLGVYAAQRGFSSSASAVNVVRDRSAQYDFINPTLYIDNSKVDFPELDTLQASLSRQVGKDIQAGNAENIAVYFRDLNTSHWTGVDTTDLFAPSSMLKLVTLLAYMHHAESDPAVLTTQIGFKPTPDPGQYYKPAHPLAPGVYTVRELLVQMITQSDNAAMQALNTLHPDWLAEVYKALELPDPSTPSDDFMSSEMYSRLYRILYGSTYLSRDDSEEVLKLLSYTDFNKGLTQGTASTTVSHKFGEHTLTDDLGNVIYRELHDCGIVYVPGHPYFLCVMTRGQDFSKLEKVIGGISALVYTSQDTAK